MCGDSFSKTSLWSIKEICVNCVLGGYLLCVDSKTVRDYCSRRSGSKSFLGSFCIDSATFLGFNLKHTFSWKGVKMTHLSRFSSLRNAALLLFSLAIAGIAVGQTSRNRASSEEEPSFREYKGIQIGWLADDVRKKLGSPADKGDEQDFFVFGEKETAQILYDKATHKVTAISVDFMNGATSVITPQQVFGADIEAKPDGSKYKMVRYPKMGYWISYSKTGGATPIVTVTIQKMQQ